MIVTDEDIINMRHEEREAWRDRIVEAYHDQSYFRVLVMMSQNYRDRGDVVAMIKNFCEDTDPEGKDL